MTILNWVLDDLAKQKAAEETLALFEVSHDELHKVMSGVGYEMRKGLESNEAHNNLKMIPSFVTGYPTGNEKGTYLALEISGVDIYVCQVRLKGEGGKLAINQYQYKIPDHLTIGDSMSTLIDYIADCVADFQRRVGSSQEMVYAMGISMGFAVRQTGLDKGSIVALEHGFEYPNAIGSDIVDLFHQRFKAKGLSVRIVAMANDAVCTLLAHAYQHPSTRIGIVHSAGTNCAYYDKVSNVKTLPADYKEGGLQSDMIINTEWCNISSQYLPINRLDEAVDIESNNKGVHAFEKMTTGMYLGELVRLVLVEYADHQILSFDIDDKECLLRVPYQFDTSYMYVCEDDNDGSLDGTRVILEEMCRTSETSLIDRGIVKSVCQLVGHRAAVLLAASIAGVVEYMVSDGVGLDPSEGFAISISGEVYKDYPSFHPRVCETLKTLIPDQIATKLSVGIVKHSRIVGAAIVAMMAEKINVLH